MPANLNNPFGESCCDGGACDDSPKRESAQPCGCDKGANHMCDRHQIEAIHEAVLRQKIKDENGIV